MKRGGFFALALVAACDVSDPVRFSADGGTGGCPTILNDERAPFADNSCAHTRCEVKAIESGCAIALTLDVCEETELRVEVAADGTLAYLESTAGSCRPTVSAPGAYFSTMCSRMNGECRIDVYPSAPGRFAEVDELTLMTVPFMPIATADREPLDSSHSGTRGYFAGAARLGDTIVVATHDGRFGGTDCTLDQPTRTFFVSARELLVKSSVATPPCLKRIVADPYGPAFIGIIGGPSHELARFDLDGTTILRQAMTATSAVPIWPSDILIDRPREQIYVSWASAEGGPERAKLTIHSLVTLEQLAGSAIFPTQLLQLGFSRQRELAASSWEERKLEFYDTDTAAFRSGFFLRTLRATSDHPGELLLHDESGLLVLGAIGDRPAILSLDTAVTNPIVATAIDYEAGAAPWALLNDPRRPSLMLVGLTESAPSYRARVARYDPLGGRYLPGSIEVGRGIVSELIEVDGAPDLIAVLPWEAKLVRLRLLE